MARFVVAATFTARPLGKVLEDGGANTVSFTPYNQMMQWLLDPRSLQPGETAVLLLRMADFVRRDQKGDADHQTLLAERAGVHLEALGRFCAGRPVAKPWLLIVPSDDAVPCQEAEERFRNLDCVHHLPWEAIARSAGTKRLFDPVADRLGHVPFTMDGFAILGGEILAKCRAGAALTEPGTTTAAPAGSSGLGAFLQKLKLRVECTPVTTPEQFADLAKLSHTVVSFHATARRYTADALRSTLNAPAMSALSIGVSDRFGNYGASGFLLIEGGEQPVIREFVLNCVVLGKQVEHCVVATLADAAAAQGVKTLAFETADAGGNGDALNFLNALCSGSEGSTRPMSTVNRLEIAATRLKDAVLRLAASPEAVAAVRMNMDGGWLQRKAHAVTG